MKAIEVKYLGPKDKTGSRIKAICDGGTLIKPFDYELEIEQNMAQAAWELAKKLGWKGEFRGGTLPNGNMVWVLGTEYYFLGA